MSSEYPMIYEISIINMTYPHFTVPYIVGVNPNSPKNPHSAMASGGFQIEEIDTDPVDETYILYGAVVGGPDKRGKFFDIRSDWPQTEVNTFIVP